MITQVISPLALAIAVWLTGSSVPAAGQNIEQSKPRNRTVIVNRVRLTSEQVASLEERFQMRVQEGSFWYDKTSGAWGIEGGPTIGMGVAGLTIGGPLRADASNGNTGVFINGRELHSMDVARLQQLGPVYQGRYWVDRYGNCGFEGGRPLFNLVQIANALAQRRGRTYLNGNSWIGTDGNGKMFGQFRDGLGNSHVFGP